MLEGHRVRQTKESYEKINVPSLAVSGWFDADFSGTPMNYPDETVRRDCRGPASANGRRSLVAHGPRPQPVAVRLRRDVAAIDWGRVYLPVVRLSPQGASKTACSTTRPSTCSSWRNQWRAASDWPLPETKWTKFYFHSGGKANSSAGDGTLSTTPPGNEPPDRYTDDPLHPTPSMFKGPHIEGPVDSRECSVREDVLVYSTPPLEEDIEVTGPLTAKLYAATSARDTDWMVRLIDVWPDGYEALLCEGALRACCRDPCAAGRVHVDSAEPDRAGQSLRVPIEFGGRPAMSS